MLLGISDRMVIMLMGEVVEEGATEDIFQAGSRLHKAFIEFKHSCFAKMMRKRHWQMNDLLYMSATDALKA